MLRVQFITLAAAAVLLAAGMDSAEGAAPSGRETPPPTVVVAKVVQVRESTPRRYVGAVESIEHVDLMPRVTGEIRKILFREGEPVRKGELLYEIEDTYYRATVDNLKAEKVSLEASLKYAEAEFKRNKRLLESHAVSVSVFDKAELDIVSARAKIKAIEASLINAENNLSYTRIHAPISGRIGISNFTFGNLVTPQSGKLTDIEQISPIYVKFSLSEREFRRDFGGLDRIRERAVVRIRLADGALYAESASVTLIDNKVNSATDTVTLRAAFQNRDHQLIPGGFVTVLLSARTEKTHCAILPSALLVRPDGEYVYVLGRDAIVDLRRIRVLGNSGKYLIVSGLDGSETVLTDGTHKTSLGGKVVPVTAEKLQQQLSVEFAATPEQER